MRKLFLFICIVSASFTVSAQTISSKVFKVTFNSVPDTAQKTFMYAISILEKHFQSPHKIHIIVTWENVANSYAKSTLNVLGDSTFPKPNVFYPIALAEKITNKDYNNPNDADIECKLKSTLNWYFGQDGNAPKGTIDLVTFVLHETCHGLGFSCSFKVESNKGNYGFDNDKTGYIANIYDGFVVNETGEYLTDTTKFNNFSSDLYQQYITGKKYFNGNIANKAYGNSRVPLYAPAKFDAGGSLAHLDSLSFLTGLDQMMTAYYIKPFNNIGSVVSGILSDIGWTHTFIKPIVQNDIEATNKSIDIFTTITSDSGFYANSVKLVYSTTNFSTKTTMPMTFSAGKYTCTIPAPGGVADVKYFIAVTDSFNRTYRMPSDSSLKPYRFHCGPDSKKPLLDHNPVTFIYSDISSLKLKANVYDNVGLDTVRLEYYVNATKKSDILFTNDSLDIYSAIINFNVGDINIGDSLRYRITAIDSSSAHNTTIYPTSGYFTIRVEKRPPLVTYYKNNFDTLTNDFILNGFSIKTETGFSSNALNTTHPYVGTGKPMVYKEYTAEFKPQVKILTSGSYMMFDEIVLVEPNIEGKQFGEFGFYDYVIVEGSKNQQSWYAFEGTGYNCRYKSDWMIKYNSSLDKNMNSLAVGDPSLFQRHYINLRSNKVFRGGDSIYIRFRLHSDAFITGWGWTIDNLVIQDSTAYADEKAKMITASIYPNPANDHITIDLPIVENETYAITISDITGRMVVQQELRNVSATISTAELAEGIYFVTITDANKNRIVVSKIVVQH